MATTYPYLRTTGTRVTFGIQMGEISKLVFTCGKEEEKKIFIVKHGLLERIILQAPDLQYPLKPRYSGILPSHIGIENRRQVGNVIQCPLQYPKTKTKEQIMRIPTFPIPTFLHKLISQIQEVETPYPLGTQAVAETLADHPASHPGNLAAEHLGTRLVGRRL